MNKNSMFFIGIDLGDKYSHLAILDRDGKLSEEARLPSTPGAFQRKFSRLDPSRVAKSRRVGPSLGLMARRDQSGGHEPHLRIAKSGDADLRQLLAKYAHCILGPFGPDCDSRRWGLKLTERGGKNIKKRAVIAVARKLAILLHHLWRLGDT